VTLYGDDPHAPYAQFQTGTCALKQISKPGRDQGQTRAAIVDFEEVERRYSRSPDVAAARAEVDVANSVLAEHEFRVGRFYMKRKAYFAAAERFRSVLEKYPRFGEKQKVYLELGRALILAKNGVEGSIYLDKLVSDYPGDPRAAEARKLLASLPSAARSGAKEGEPKPH
jgi:outer membrane protein assembly factor BamD